MSYAKLRGRIREIFGTEDNFAAAIGTNRATLSKKLNNKSPWKNDEIQTACDKLNISIDEVHQYFFEKKS